LFQIISTEEGRRLLMIALSVKCPLPVAARLPKSVTRKEKASTFSLMNRAAANPGPMVWLEEGPLPILKISFIDSRISCFQIHI